jgi:hypothetical protein
MKMGAKVQKLLEMKDKVASSMKTGLTGRAASPTVAAKPSEAPAPAALPADLPDDTRS